MSTRADEPPAAPDAAPLPPRFPRTGRIAAQILDLLSPRRRALRALRARWGQPGANDGWLASRYFELTALEDATRQVDERTWNDLELARIFSKLDASLTRIGSQSLYRRLRTYRNDDAAARAEYVSMQALRTNRRLREGIQLILMGVQADTAAHVCGISLRGYPPASRACKQPAAH